MLACCTAIVTIPLATSVHWTGPSIVTTLFCVPGANSPRLLMLMRAPESDWIFLSVTPARPRMEPISLSGTWRVSTAVAASCAACSARKEGAMCW